MISDTSVWYQHSIAKCKTSIGKVVFTLRDIEVHQASMQEHCGICNGAFKPTNKIKKSKSEQADSKTILCDAAFAIL
jgi:hypothetical protein